MAAEQGNHLFPALIMKFSFMPLALLAALAGPGALAVDEDVAQMLRHMIMDEKLAHDV